MLSVAPGGLVLVSLGSSGVWGGAGKGEPMAEEDGGMCERVRGSHR